MGDLNIKQEDIDELFIRHPIVKDKLTIIAHERIIEELKRQVDQLAKDKLDIKRVKAS